MVEAEPRLTTEEGRVHAAIRKLLGTRAVLCVVGVGVGAAFLVGCTGQSVSTTAGASVPSPSVSATSPSAAPAGAGSWTDLKPSGALPEGRENQSMVTDPLSQEVIMFGGMGGNGPLSDTWAYDPSADTWTDLNPSGAVPDARYGGAMVYDSSTGKVIMFGGSGANGPLNDIWAYDPTANTWTNLNPSGTLPKARDATALVSDASTNKLIMFGGVGMSGQLNDTWAYDPTANTWTDLQPSGTVPDARAGQSMAYDPSTGKVIMFGGFGSASLNDTWAYDPGANTWTDLKPSGTLPPARNNFSLSYEASLDQVVAFGGFSDSNYLSDTWAYDPSANTWTDLNPSGTLPDARDGGSMAYDPTSQKVILFGGYDGTNYLNDTWAYSS